MSKDDYRYSLPDVEALIREFEACRLPRERWTHEAHLTVGLWYLSRHDEAEATTLIRNGIKRYNQACGIQQTKTSGYHETITLFYVRIIRRYLKERRVAASLDELAKGLMKACGDRALPFEYYSRERLLSWDARKAWVEPDLKPLD
jgi:hypothetical protein